MDKPLSTLAAGITARWAVDLVDSQKQMTQDEIDELLKEKETPTAQPNEVIVNAPVAASTPNMPETNSEGIKYVMESPYEATLKGLLKSAELFGINGYVAQGIGSNTNYFLVLDEEYDVLSHSGQREEKDARKTQRAMTQDELAAEILGTPTQQTPIVHASKEFVEDDVLVSQEDLDALKQLEDLEGLGDINLDDLDLDNLDDLDI
jgi:hypothetical protein